MSNIKQTAYAVIEESLKGAQSSYFAYEEFKNKYGNLVVEQVNRGVGFADLYKALKTGAKNAKVGSTLRNISENTLRKVYKELNPPKQKVLGVPQKSLSSAAPAQPKA